MSVASIETQEFLAFEEHVFEEIELESMIVLQFNQETLKQNFVALIKILKDLKLSVRKTNKKQKENEKSIQELQNENKILQEDNKILKEDINQIKKENTQMKQEIEQIKQKDKQQDIQLQELKQQSENQDQEIKCLQKDNQKNKDDIQYILDELKKLKNEIENVKLLLQLSTGKTGDLDENSYQLIIKEIQKIKEEYVTQKEFKDQNNEFNLELKEIKQLIEKLKNHFSDILSSFQEFQERLKHLEKQMKNKVDIEFFDQQINYLKQLIQSNFGNGKELIQPQTVFQGLSENQLSLLNAVKDKLSDLEFQIRELRNQLKEQNDEIQNLKQKQEKYQQITDNRLDDLESQIKNCTKNSQFKKLEEQVNKLREEYDKTANLSIINEENIQQLRNIIGNLVDQIKRQASQYTNQGSGGVSEELLNQKLKELKDELMNLIKQLQDQMKDKVSYDDLYKSENLLLQKLDDVALAFVKKFADKADTKKALQYLEKKINELFKLLNKENNGKDKEDDALVAKRPLLWSCISCDKGLDDYQGRLGDYKYWNVFPPKETTPERMGKFGKQYRYMQEKSQQRDKLFEQSKQSGIQQSVIQQNQHIQGEFLPSITK